MLKLRINPLVVDDLKEIRDYIAEDNEEYAAKTLQEIYSKFENIQMFPGIGADLSGSNFLQIIFELQGNEMKNIFYWIKRMCMIGSCR